jgi:hypothetical protein
VCGGGGGNDVNLSFGTRQRGRGGEAMGGEQKSGGLKKKG